MGGIISDEEFTAIILTSLPKSYDPVISFLSLTSKTSKQKLNLDVVISSIYDEADRRKITTSSDNSSTDIALTTAQSVANHSASKTDTRRCYNCNGSGHISKDCPKPRRPRQQSNNQNQNQHHSGRRYPYRKHYGNYRNHNSHIVTTDDPQDDLFVCIASETNIMQQNTDNIPIIIDSGASRHFSPNRQYFLSLTDISHETVHTASGPNLKAVAKGDMIISLPNGHCHTHILLRDTLYVPQMTSTLISVNRLEKAGYAIHIENNVCQILSPRPKR